MRAVQRSICVLGLLCASFGAWAGESPEDVVLAYLAAMQADGVAAAAARYTHPDDCAGLKNLMMPRIRRSFATPTDDFVADTFGERLSLEELEAMPPPTFLAKFLWRSQIDAKSFELPRFVGSTRDGDVVRLTALTRTTSKDGFTADRRDVITLRAFGDGWRMAIDEKLLKYAVVLISK
jgi:hypothetical protein